MTGAADGGNRVSAWLNRLALEDAVVALRRCCASRRWARAVAAARPFGTDEELLAVVEGVWWGLEPADWREAFAAHPRIGERGGGAWSDAEQSGMDAASERLQREIREANRVYEERFGHVFLICATGLGAEEMAEALARRLENDAATELRNAAAEQAKITRLRLGKLMTRDEGLGR